MEESRAKQIVNELREEMFATELQAGREAKQVFEELASVHVLTEMDMKEYGPHRKHGGWRLGLLAARNIEMDAGSGARTDLGKDLPRLENGQKISARTFARGTGVSHPTVVKDVKTWNAAADERLVPYSWELALGQEVEWDEEKHTEKKWKELAKTPGEERETSAVDKIENIYKAVSNFEMSSLNREAFEKTETHPDDVEAWFQAFIDFGEAGKDRLNKLTVEAGWTIQAD